MLIASDAAVDNIDVKWMTLGNAQTGFGERGACSYARLKPSAQCLEPANLFGAQHRARKIGYAPPRFARHECSSALARRDLGPCNVRGQVRFQSSSVTREKWNVLLQLSLRAQICSRSMEEILETIAKTS